MSIRIVIDTRHVRDFGIGTYIRNLVHALARLDEENQYFLVVYPQDREAFPGLPPNFEVAVYERPDSSLLDQVAFPLYLRRFWADACHIPLNVVPLLMPKPYVVTVHDMSSLLYEELHGRQKRFRLYQFRRGLERSDAVIAVSNATRRDVEDLFGIRQGKIRQIYGAADPRFIEPAQRPGAGERQRLLERFQISYPFLLHVGTIRPQKNIPRLVEAFAVLRGDLEQSPAFRDLRLIIIGDDISRHPAVRRTVIQTRMEQYVRFLGFVPFDALRTFYAAAAAFVFPSLYEGFGLPPLEAMASGTPVVTSNISSLPEVVGNAAVLVNPENVFEIAKGLREVLTNDTLRVTLTQRGHQQVRRFNWDSTARQVLELYRQVAEGPKGP
ncbi:MAG TPA: glycosyltransferase family 1 protein [Bryobacteraceae bacterium]|nr:glycosyltransferase family 1 protein [Bryobacteraceae bacterium]